MIPNIFISSTISDLHYLRDGLREAVEDLGYHPIMSDYGEVGYINPSTAAESCYRSVKQCQIVVLVVGKRYGNVGTDSLSVTHREFRTAQIEQIPTITFVEPQVLSYKEVYDADPEVATWARFAPMDHATNTFELLNEVAASEAYNAIVPFTSVSDAKRQLKFQIADFVGDRLSQVLQPARKQLQAALAQIKTMRNELTHSSVVPVKDADRSQRYLITMRFLLDDKHAEFRAFAEMLFEDIDAAIDAMSNAETFEEFIAASSYTINVEENYEGAELLKHIERTFPVEQRRYSFRSSSAGAYVVLTERRIICDQNRYDVFKRQYSALSIKLGRQN